MLENKEETESETAEAVLKRRLAIFSLASIRSPVEIRLKYGRTATGILSAFDPQTFNMVIKGLDSAEEKAENKCLNFADIECLSIFTKSPSERPT